MASMERDPIIGLMNYINTVKPYHSKILDTVVEYLAEDKIDANINELISLTIDIINGGEDTPIERDCGYGIIWDIPVGGLDPRVGTIIEAISDLSFDVSITQNTDEIQVINNTVYNITIGDIITFDTTATLPTIQTGLIQPGQEFEVLTVTGGMITVANIGDVTPVTFVDIGSGQLSILVRSTLKNSFLVSVTNDTPKSIAVARQQSNRFAYTTNHTIGNVIPTGKTWVANGDITSELVIGGKIFINDNYPSANGEYTIVSYNLSGGNTSIVVQESISLNAIQTGSLSVLADFDTLPFIPTGSAVTLSSSGTLPSPLQSNTDYYYIRLSQLGYFALSTVRYSTNIDDIIKLTSNYTGNLEMSRSEIYSPGTNIRVMGSANGNNDGDYIVQRVESEGTYQRIYVTRAIPQTTQSGSTTDGNVAVIAESYSAPAYCPAINGPNLLADILISDELEIEVITV